MYREVCNWREARELVEEFQRLDPGHELVFGSSGHQYRILEPVSEKRLLEFEKRNGVEIPTDYRAFLSIFGAGGAGPHYGIYDFADVENVSVDQPFHLTETMEWPDEDDDPMWDLPGLLTISTSGCAIDWYLEVNGPQPGTLWVNAGPGSELMRCESFGYWYTAWLDRVAFGLTNHERLRNLVDQNLTVQQLRDELGVESYEWTWDGVVYLRFRGVPGQVLIDGDAVVSLSVGASWIR